MKFFTVKQYQTVKETWYYEVAANSEEEAIRKVESGTEIPITYEQEEKADPEYTCTRLQDV